MPVVSLEAHRNRSRKLLPQSSAKIPSGRHSLHATSSRVASLSLKNIKDEYHGIYLGLLIANLSISLRKKYRETNKYGSLKGYKHDIFPALPRKEEWKVLVENQVSLCLHVFSASSKLPSENKPLLYKKIKRLQEGMLSHLSEILIEQIFLEWVCIGLIKSFCWHGHRLLSLLESLVSLGNFAQLQGGKRLQTCVCALGRHVHIAFVL